MDFPIHNPREAKYKFPVGAVKNDTQIRIAIETPRHYEVTDAVLCIKYDAQGLETEIQMEKSAAADECDTFSAALDTEGYTGLLFYYFRLCCDGGKPYFYAKMDPTHEHPEITGGIYNEKPEPWQITIYDKTFTAPVWYGEGITYQIFPDRFARSHVPTKRGCKAERIIHEDWSGIPEYREEKNHIIQNNDFFGGNLRGIISKLDYLEELGIKTIYLNPIFEAQSNHRYDTANYERLDPMFGTEKQFIELCKRAKKKDMHIIIDGVFSHTGADSVYFNKYGHYNSVGAYQSRESSYCDWYKFKEFPDSYECWWDVLILPSVNELDKSYLDYIVRASESIVRKWVRLGASGWRLDVADELPDAFIEEIRSAVKEENPDALIIGEVWEDASNKVAYAQRRKYFNGFELDSVMNYPLRDAILDFLWGGDALDFRIVMENILLNYPEDVIKNLMNIIGTHDTSRILTALGFKGDGAAMGRDGRAIYHLNNEERTRGKMLLHLATAIQFTFPGSPTIYYGDEAGMEGFEDPFNRMCYPWGEEDGDVMGWYRSLCTLRNTSRALKYGKLKFLYALGDILAYERATDTEKLTIIINRGDNAHALPFEISGIDLVEMEKAGMAIGANTVMIIK